MTPRTRPPARTTASVIGIGEDLASTIREKAVGAVADATVAAAQERLDRDPEPGPPAAGTDAAAGTETPDEPPAAPSPSA